LRAPPDSRATAEEVARQLARAGLRVRVRPVSGTVGASGAVDAMSIGRLPARSAALGAYPSLADLPPLANGTLRDPEYLRRVDRVLHAEDSLAHRAALVALQDHVAAQAPALALYWDEFLVPVSERRFTGWTAAAGLGIPHWGLWTRLTPVSTGSRPESPWAAIVAGLALAAALLLSLTRTRLPRWPRSLPRLPWAEARLRRKP
jgi:hypothetical protein